MEEGWACNDTDAAKHNTGNSRNGRKFMIASLPGDRPSSGGGFVIFGSLYNR